MARGKATVPYSPEQHATAIAERLAAVIARRPK